MTLKLQSWMWSRLASKRKSPFAIVLSRFRKHRLAMILWW